MRRSIGWSFIKFNRGLEKGKKPSQVVEMHNGSGKMMMKGTSLCMIHGSLWTMKYGMKKIVECKNAAEGSNLGETGQGQYHAKTAKRKRKKQTQ